MRDEIRRQANYLQQGGCVGYVALPMLCGLFGIPFCAATHSAIAGAVAGATIEHRKGL